ncbi:hypothetical protein [Pseudomonas vancouverensis]|uniref:Uncharacterized protein n=1 Tax=Pseudomonas vancouverensis TaxID=95300 RepID=A0A1H2MJN9_PSEVA|nr:hypothetical protein [Pseudomonas vancouverensis]KAB0494797.1 hypothetical protein F7R09_19320 [Pseudomonas vancouverensis]TDB63561.1 hypothetical protein EIY72_12800 [Pseudomonas vancouverensis]SDU93284.1 hypothetical protein SAMN05216558_0855 [Pseudomonas vancouverensis]
MNTANLVFISLGGVFVVGVFLSLGSALYISYTKGDQISTHFKKGSTYLAHGIYRRSSFYGRVHLIGWISSALTFPQFFLKRGLVSAEEIDSFPFKLKRQLVILQWTFIGLFIAMVLLVIVGKSGVLS